MDSADSGPDPGADFLSSPDSGADSVSSPDSGADSVSSPDSGADSVSSPDSGADSVSGPDSGADSVSGSDSVAAAAVAGSNPEADTLLSRLRVIEDQALDTRAEAFTHVYDQLRLRLEGGDQPA